MTDVYQTYLASPAQEMLANRFGLFCDLAVGATGSDESSILLLDSASDVLRFVTTMSKDGPETKLIGFSVPMGEGITGLAAKSGEVQIGAPTYDDADLSEATGAVQHVVAAPIIGKTGLLGAATAISFGREDSYGMEDARRLAGVAEAAALAIDTMMADELSAGTELSQRTYEIVQRLAASLNTLPSQDPVLMMSVEALLEHLETVLRAASSGRGADRSI
ncbi:MAG: GAF domain-containing protein [Pseudomonadota bacterium]